MSFYKFKLSKLLSFLHVQAEIHGNGRKSDRLFGICQNKV